MLYISGFGVTEISTKTGSMKNAGTDDYVSLTVCDTTGACCTTALDNKSVDDRQKGRVDTFADSLVLGDCFNARLDGQLTATLSKLKSDGWYVEWAKIKLSSGKSFTCLFNSWLDNSGGHKNSMTVTCNKGKELCYITINI